MNYPLVFIILYFIIMNIFTFILYFADKRKAINHRWRIPEATLLATAFAGGSFGAFSAMRVFRHKTKHLKFTLTVPLMMILHAVFLIFVVIKLT